MRRLTSVKRDLSSIRIVPLGFGAMLLFMGIMLHGTDKGLLSSWQFDGSTDADLIELGAVLLLCWLVLVVQERDFGPEQATIAPDLVKPGEYFDFSFSLPIKRDLNVLYINTYLVYRERDQYRVGDDPTIVDLDRVYDSHESGSNGYRSGETLKLHQRFHMPTHGPRTYDIFRTRPNSRVETMWAVKVRIQTDRLADVWHEFEIPAALFPLIERDDTVSVVLDQLNRFDFVSRAGIREAMPHLTNYELGKICYNLPCPLAIGVSREEGERLKGLFEAVGACVTIQEHCG